MNKRDFLLPVPNLPPDEGDLHRVQFGKQWLPIVLTAMESFLTDVIWDTPPDDIVAQVEELMSELAIDVPPLTQVYERNFFFHPSEFLIAVGNPQTLAVDTSQVTNFLAYQDTAGATDYMSVHFNAQAGTYDLVVLAKKQNNAGKIRVQLDGVTTILDADLYSASVVRNVALTASFSISDEGEHSLVVKVNGKNASSSSYYLPISYISMHIP